MRILPHLRFLFFVMASLWLSQAQGAHIIGGEFSYECLGGGNYRFTLRLYRDCAGGGALFDGAPGAPFSATVSIYEGNSNVPINISLGAPSVKGVDLEISNPCLIVPPGICVEEGVYTFTRNLPLSNQSYHITYQRCCRNNSITNIVDPGNSGATYTIELTALAQSLCNNSPSFQKVPPIVICAGQDINYDFSASDVDGDALKYYLCTPYLGGGTNQTQWSLPNGVAPNPDMPPPYNPVFFSPPYSSFNPMGGNPPLSIDPNTGLISGVPNQQGQFVVGVCVEEYRNGQLLSVSRRDFQFNVTDCEPTVVADIEEDAIINGQDFLVISCGQDTVDFTNQSYQLQFINNFEWVFDINGTPQSFADWDASVVFPGIGTYEGKLLLNPGTTCADTANIFVTIFPEVVSNFSFEYDTCNAGSVDFTDLSYSGAGPGTITEWAWNFDDLNTASVQNPGHLYQIPGTFLVKLRVTDVNGCKDVQVYPLPYYPVPDLIVVAPSEFVGCEPAEITFTNLSFPIDESYTVAWDFGDGNTGVGLSPTHEYTEPGLYSILLSITSPLGCYTDTAFIDWIEILPSPDAGFTYTPSRPSNIEPTVQFIDQSKEAVSWRWDFSGIGFSLLSDPVFTFPDTGLQVVTQIVTHASGCRDTAVQVIDVIPEVRYFLPNAFTPNGDGINDTYRGEGIMEGVQRFRFQVWNRYGELIFESDNPYEGWNGRKQNVGDPAPSGVYVVVVSYQTPRGENMQLKGYAVLVD
ncbi:MAG: gliding motility-associated C-terminal domain-containing protein [Saprospirales bacterium]|nr:gliding motility-associated C-terminal domain-containing protein [Saprospirales bacterium]